MSGALLFAACVALLLAWLYAHRMATKWDEQAWPERCARLAVGVVVGSLAPAFYDAAQAQDAPLWRQWMVLGAMCAAVAAYAVWWWTDRNGSRPGGSREGPGREPPPA